MIYFEQTVAYTSVCTSLEMYVYPPVEWRTGTNQYIMVPYYSLAAPISPSPLVVFEYFKMTSSVYNRGISKFLQVSYNRVFPHPFHSSSFNLLLCDQPSSPPSASRAASNYACKLQVSNCVYIHLQTQMFCVAWLMPFEASFTKVCLRLFRQCLRALFASHSGFWTVLRRIKRKSKSERARERERGGDGEREREREKERAREKERKRKRKKEGKRGDRQGVIKAFVLADIVSMCRPFLCGSMMISTHQLQINISTHLLQTYISNPPTLDLQIHPPTSDLHIHPTTPDLHLHLHPPTHTRTHTCMFSF